MTSVFGVLSFILGITAFVAMIILWIITLIVYLNKSSSVKGLLISSILTTGFWFLTLIVFIASAASSESTEASRPKKSTVKKETQKKPEQKPTPAKPAEPKYKMGNSVKVGYWTYKVSEVKEFDSIKDVFGEKKLPAEGARFIQIKVTVTNNDKDESNMSSSMLKLIEKDGTEYSVDTESTIYLPGEQLIFEPINPKTSKTGYFLFDVPKTVKLSDLHLQVGGGLLSSETEKIILQ